VPTVFRAPFTKRAWAEFGYAVVGGPLGLLGFAFAIGSVLISVVLLGTLLGLPLITLGLLLARTIASAHRALARRLLGLTVHAPVAVPADRQGFLGWLGSCLKDSRGWRAYAYLLVKFPVALAGFTVALVLRVGGAVLLLSPVVQQPGDARRVTNHGGYVSHPIQYGQFHFDTWPKILLLVLQGALMILISPWALRPIVLLDRALIRLLLGPTPPSGRVLDLERSRAMVVDESAARLRRIERDLHDGAQAQLVAVAMKLSLAMEKLAPEPSRIDIVRVRELVATAHTTARSAIVDLRDLVAGIHPPILNDGLPAALATLGARAAIPTELTVDLPVRPSPAIETIAYFCAAELLTNVAKHSGAGRATLSLTSHRGSLLLTVEDDGTGGAAAHSGSGLGGLAERVRNVDGSLSILSPPGGPTTINVELPVHV
jgi:signal transduction histidine kinase